MIINRTGCMNICRSGRSRFVFAMRHAGLNARSMASKSRHCLGLTARSERLFRTKCFWPVGRSGFPGKRPPGSLKPVEIRCSGRFSSLSITGLLTGALRASPRSESMRFPSSKGTSILLWFTRSMQEQDACSGVVLNARKRHCCNFSRSSAQESKGVRSRFDFCEGTAPYLQRPYAQPYLLLALSALGQCRC